MINIFKKSFSRLLKDKLFLILLGLLVVGPLLTLLFSINNLKKTTYILKDYLDYKEAKHSSNQFLYVPSPYIILDTYRVDKYFLDGKIQPDGQLFITSSIPVFFDFAANFDQLISFSSLILYFGGFPFLFLGFEAFRQRNYKQLLRKHKSNKRVFYAILGSGASIIFLFMIVLISCTLVTIKILGIDFPINQYLIYFFLILFGILLFYFSIGAALSLKSEERKAFKLLFACFGIILLTAPINQYFFKAETFENVILTSNTIYYPFEGSAVNISDYMFPKESLKEHLGLLIPTTFFQKAVENISGKGYQNIIEFYKFALSRKPKNPDAITVNLFLSNQERSGRLLDKNIFNARGSIDYPDIIGFLILTIYTFGLLSIPYDRGKKIFNTMHFKARSKKSKKNKRK